MSCDGFSVTSRWSLDLGGEIGIKSSRGGDLCLLERPSIFTWKMCNIVTVEARDCSLVRPL